MPQIIVVPYAPHWPDAYARAAAEIERAVGGNLLAVHHIGSTSIPGIYAKPVIDILAVVADLAALDHHSYALEAIGYESLGEFGIPRRRYFRRDDAGGQRTHQIHAFQTRSQHIKRHLAFRDYLRVHPDVAREYSDLKRELAAKHADDREAYMDGKDGFVQRVEKVALAWVAAGRPVD